MEARQHFGVRNCWTTEGKIVVLLPDKTRKRIEVLSELKRLTAVYPPHKDSTTSRSSDPTDPPQKKNKAQEQSYTYDAAADACLTRPPPPHPRPLTHPVPRAPMATTALCPHNRNIVDLDSTSTASKPVPTLTSQQVKNTASSSCDTRTRRKTCDPPLIVCHQNIQSLGSKTKKLEVLLKSELKCDAIVFSEHWLKDYEIKSVTLNNFDLISYYCRPTMEHGGCCIYVKQGIRAINMTDYSDLSQQQLFEVCAVKLVDDNMLIVGVYHSNKTSHPLFVEHFEKLLSKINDDGLDTLVVGDTNINLLINSSNKDALLDVINACNFSQFVDGPTRITDTTATLLDHSYSNIRADRVSATIIDARLSDHTAQKTCITRTVPNRPEPQIQRKFTLANKINFGNELESVDWANVINEGGDNCHQLAECLLRVLINKFNLCFPKKVVTFCPQLSPWVDEEVINLKGLLYDVINLKNIFPAVDAVNVFADKVSTWYGNQLNKKRTEYYDKTINTNNNKRRAMWSVINNELSRKCRERIDFSELIKECNGLPLSSKQEVVDALNREFVGAAASCGAPPADVRAALDSMTTHTPPLNRSVRLRPFTPGEVDKILCTNIAPKSSTDIYDLSPSLLKFVCLVINKPLSHLFNLSIKHGIFPEPLKRVKIVPLYKGKGKKSASKSYRPISLVPVFSKIFEVGLNQQILSFWKNQNVMSDRQYAYQPGRSTTDLVREVVWSVLGAREAGLQVAVLCCDLSRAFDTADHSLVANKLDHYGLRGPALSMLVSFMKDRTQTVVGDRGRVASAELKNIMGVPQGSCLSNTLFTILLNDLPNALKGVEVFMYADDVTAVITARNEHLLECALNETVNKLRVWFTINGLSLNKEKTCFMRFSLNGHTPNILSVNVGGSILQQVASAKLLGFDIDSSLTWQEHINSLCSRLAQACYALRRLAYTASREVVRTCYFATVHSVLSYGSELWAQCADWERVFRMQKRAVRSIVGIASDESVREHFKDLRIMTLPSIHVQQMAIFMFHNIDSFSRKGSIPTHNLRSNAHKNRVIPPAHKLARSEQSVYVLGPAIYNRLPESIRVAKSLQCFKAKTQSWLLANNFYSLSEVMDLPITT
ncbi:reverse transcriptase (RNA-dependent DNA polymerase) domain-containing protein [Phthorimaea operculella]|nr:reverse transcriptase (RNA-dependent DNA polymerase) domain-containing protein [Phthorimaea operculella]